MTETWWVYLPFATQWTPMWFISAVQQEMVLEVGLFGESSVTYVAFEGPGAVMNVHVRLEITGSGE